MLENTSLTIKDILDLTIEELEYILEGFNKKNQRSTGNDSEVLTGKSAIEALKQLSSSRV